MGKVLWLIVYWKLLVNYMYVCTCTYVLYTCTYIYIYILYSYIHYIICTCTYNNYILHVYICTYVQLYSKKYCVHMHTCTYMYVCMYNYAEQTTPTLGVVPASPSNQQLLDQLPVERERGITVKAQTATMFYNKIGTDKQTHMLNLIDTPVRLMCHLSLLIFYNLLLPYPLPPSLYIILITYPSHYHSLIVICLFRLYLFLLVTMDTQYLPHTITFHPHSPQGHVDFSHEVSRSLAACDGVVLLVDAHQVRN